MYALILLSIILETTTSMLWSGKPFVLYLFIAFAEFATLTLAVRLSHEYKRLLVSVLFYSIIIHLVWSVVTFLALSLVNGSVILWDLGYQNIYPKLYDLLKLCAFILTTLELLVLFAPPLARLTNGAVRNSTANNIGSNGYFLDTSGVLYKARSQRVKEGQR